MVTGVLPIAVARARDLQVCNPVTQAQQNFVLEVPLANGSTAYVWTGDKWQQAPNGKYGKREGGSRPSFQSNVTTGGAALPVKRYPI